MKTALLLFGVLGLWAATGARAADYAIGADLSFLKQAEDRGYVFKDNNEAKPGLQIFKDHGYNWIRLRLFHTPTQLPNNLEYTIALAKAARQLGYKFLLDYHYSDTWADPGKQFIPKAWEGMSHDQMVQALFDYTKQTTIAFREAGVLAGHGADRQRNHQRHALARRQTARQLGQLRRLRQGRNRRRGSRHGRRRAPAHHDPHRQGRRRRPRRNGSSTS